MKYCRLAVLFVVAVCLGCSASVDPGKPSNKSYEVVELKDVDFSLDGKADELAWKEARLLDDFSYPWAEKWTLSALPTKFRAFCDNENLYFIFEVEDPDIVIEEPSDDEMDVAVEDRVEIYFAADLKLDKYYSVEMDLTGRRLDYKARFHRDFDFSWTFPDLKTAGRRTENGYVVEGVVPLKTLESLGLPSLESGKLRAGFYRAEFSHTDGGPPKEEWISWVNPNTVAEDFHIPGTLGILKKAPGQPVKPADKPVEKRAE
jgi:Carbohydrate family 9 binding domain-like